MFMQILLLFTLFIQVQPKPDLHSLINEVRAEQRKGDYVSALDSYKEKVLPKLDEAPNNLRVNAELLEILILKKLGETELALHKADSLLIEFPDDLPVHRMQALSHKANLHYDNLQIDEFYSTQKELFRFAEVHNDGNRMSRAIGNMYYYFDHSYQRDSIEVYLDKLEIHLKDYPSNVNEIRFHVLNGRFERDFNKDLEASLIHFGKSKSLIDKETRFSWYETVTYEKIKTLLVDGNLTLAESELVALLREQGTNQNPNVLYVAYSNLVRLQVLKEDLELAEQYFKLMKMIPQSSLNYISIEEGVYAKIALKGDGNAWEMDPVFQYYKKSGFGTGGLISVIMILSILFYGALTAYKNRFKSTSKTLLNDSLHWSLVE